MLKWNKYALKILYT